MPPLPSIITPALLSSIRKHPNLPHHTWYFITATTLSILNRPDELPILYKYLLEHGPGHVDSRPTHDEQLRASRRIREAIIKSAAIGGLPKAINSLLSLKTATPEPLLDAPQSYSPTSRPTDIYDVPSSAILARGASFFSTLYGKVARRVMSNMDNSGTEDLGLTARLMYGYILSNVNVLSPAETSFVLIAGLIPQDLNPQLKGHLRGALNGGASVEEVRAVREVVVRICEEAGMRRLEGDEKAGLGWRGEVANL